MRTGRQSSIGRRRNVSTVDVGVSGKNGKVGSSGGRGRGSGRGADPRTLWAPCRRHRQSCSREPASRSTVCLWLNASCMKMGCFFEHRKDARRNSVPGTVLNNSKSLIWSHSEAKTMIEKVSINVILC